MTISLKVLSAEAIPRALEKAERYRLLNQPWAAESICQDIVAVQPGHQAALRTLLLSITDQFSVEGAGRSIRAREVLARLTGEYERAYYAGIIAERRAKVNADRRGPGAGHMAYELLREAMEWYEKADRVKPAGNDDAVLRWNTCARMLNGSTHIVARHQEGAEAVIGE